LTVFRLEMAALVRPLVIGKRRKFRRARTAPDNVRYQPGSVVDIVKSNPAMIAAFFYQRGYLFKSGAPQFSSGHSAFCGLTPP